MSEKMTDAQALAFVAEAFDYFDFGPFAPDRAQAQAPTEQAP